MCVYGIELQFAAERLVKHLNVPDFTASGGFFVSDTLLLIVKRAVLSADIDTLYLHKIINELGLMLAQVYNADETGLFWCSLLENTQAYRN